MSRWQQVRRSGRCLAERAPHLLQRPVEDATRAEGVLAAADHGGLQRLDVTVADGTHYALLATVVRRALLRRHCRCRCCRRRRRHRLVRHLVRHRLVRHRLLVRRHHRHRLVRCRLFVRRRHRHRLVFLRRRRARGAAGRGKAGAGRREFVLGGLECGEALERDAASRVFRVPGAVGTLALGHRRGPRAWAVHAERRREYIRRGRREDRRYGRSVAGGGGDGRHAPCRRGGAGRRCLRHLIVQLE